MRRVAVREQGRASQNGPLPRPPEAAIDDAITVAKKARAEATALAGGTLERFSSG
jgi:hypothetical protein